MAMCQHSHPVLELLSGSRNGWKDGLSQLPRRMFCFLLTVSPSFHGVEEANTICWATDLDQVFPAHPQEVSTYDESSRNSAHRCRMLLSPKT